MSTDRDVTRIVRSWLEEGVTALPDRVLDAVLDQVPATSTAPCLVAGAEVPRHEQSVEARDRGRRDRGRRRCRDQSVAQTRWDRWTRSEPDGGPVADPVARRELRR